ncbi:hypothetical protein PR048_002695 [Dryococelus australis]|uniref:Uncharacterized protein n=1 Tax=Dryococelus australis TaxID=614101 RepID=A0ABQ9IKY0_9NEOP|nr:hypothetical protein PR048_002695 [Dryococelus australis]
MCNSTRLLIKDLKENLIIATILTGPAAGQLANIPRIPMIPTDLPISFKRSNAIPAVCAKNRCEVRRGIPRVPREAVSYFALYLPRVSPTPFQPLPTSPCSPWLLSSLVNKPQPPSPVMPQPPRLTCSRPSYLDKESMVILPPTPTPYTELRSNQPFTSPAMEKGRGSCPNCRVAPLFSATLCLHSRATAGSSVPSCRRAPYVRVCVPPPHTTPPPRRRTSASRHLDQKRGMIILNWYCWENEYSSVSCSMATSIACDLPEASTCLSAICAVKLLVQHTLETARRKLLPCDRQFEDKGLQLEPVSSTGRVVCTHKSEIIFRPYQHWAYVVDLGEVWVRIGNFAIRRLSTLAAHSFNLGEGDDKGENDLELLIGCSPPTKANRVQSHPRPGHRLVGIVPDDAAGRPVFSGISHFPPPIHSGAAPYTPQSPSSALKTSLLRAAEISSLFTRQCSGHQRNSAYAEMTTNVTPFSVGRSGAAASAEISPVGIVPDDVADRAGFSQGSAISFALAFRRCSMFAEVRPHRVSSTPLSSEPQTQRTVSEPDERPIFMACGTSATFDFVLSRTAFGWRNPFRGKGTKQYGLSDASRRSRKTYNPVIKGISLRDFIPSVLNFRKGIRDEYRRHHGMGWQPARGATAAADLHGRSAAATAFCLPFPADIPWDRTTEPVRPRLRTTLPQHTVHEEKMKNGLPHSPRSNTYTVQDVVGPIQNDRKLNVQTAGGVEAIYPQFIPHGRMGHAHLARYGACTSGEHVVGVLAYHFLKPNSRTSRGRSALHTNGEGIDHGPALRHHPSIRLVWFREIVENRNQFCRTGDRTHVHPGSKAYHGRVTISRIDSTRRHNLRILLPGGFYPQTDKLIRHVPPLRHSGGSNRLLRQQRLAAFLSRDGWGGGGRLPADVPIRRGWTGRPALSYTRAPHGDAITTRGPVMLDSTDDLTSLALPRALARGLSATLRRALQLAPQGCPDYGGIRNNPSRPSVILYTRRLHHLSYLCGSVGRGGVVVRLLVFHLGEPVSIPGGGGPRIVRIVLDGAADQRVFSGISRFRYPCIPSPFLAHLFLPSQAVKTQIRATKTSHGTEKLGNGYFSGV